MKSCLFSCCTYYLLHEKPNVQHFIYKVLNINLFHLVTSAKQNDGQMKGWWKYN